MDTSNMHVQVLYVIFGCICTWLLGHNSDRGLLHICFLNLTPDPTNRTILGWGGGEGAVMEKQ